MTEKPHERLDQLMNDRRLQLPKTGGKTVKWFQVAERAGITVTTLNALRKGQNEATEDTKRGVEQALLWEPGSIDAILSGGDPTIREQRGAIQPAVEIDEARSFRTVITEAMSDDLDDLPEDPDERIAELRRHVERQTRAMTEIFKKNQRLMDELARIAEQNRTRDTG